MAYNPQEYWTEREHPTNLKSVPQDLEFLLSMYLKDAEFILDAGCGVGRTFSLYPKVPVVGIDFVDTYRDKAKQKAADNGLSLSHFLHDLNQPLPYTDAIFSHAVAIKVLLHMEDPQIAISELARVSDQVFISDTWDQGQIAHHVFVHDYKKLLEGYKIHRFEREHNHLNIVYSEK